MTGDGKPGDAVTDKWREVFEKNRRETEVSLTRLEVRSDMKSMGEDEISSVIDQRTLEAQRKKESEPPTSGYGGQAIMFVRSVKAWPQVIVALSVLALVAWYMWLHK